MDPREAGWGELSAEQLNAFRKKIGEQIQLSMSDYTNQHLWEDEKAFVPKKVEEPDPADIKDLKNCFFALYHAEESIKAMNELNKWTQEDIGIKAVTFARLLVELKNTYTSISNISSLTELAFIKTEISKLIDTLNGTNYTNLSWTTIFNNTQTIFNALKNGISEKIYSLSGYRESIPVISAKKYEQPPVIKEEIYSLNPERIRDFELSYILNPFRTLMLELEKTFPKDMKFSQVDFDQHGYLVYVSYKDRNNEPPVFRSVKALYNIMWAINRIVRGYYQHKGKKIIHAHYNAVPHVKKALNNYWLLDWNGIYEEMKNRTTKDAYVNFLRTTREIIKFDGNPTHAIQEFEITHHLKPGAILNPLRDAFDKIRDIYLDNNIYFENPFINSLQPHFMLDSKEDDIEQHRLHDLKEICKNIETNLEHYLYGTLPDNKTEKDTLLWNTLQNFEKIINNGLANEEPDKTNAEETIKLLIKEISFDKQKELIATIQNMEEKKQEEKENKYITKGLQIILKKLIESNKSQEENRHISNTSTPSWRTLTAIGTLMKTYTPKTLQLGVTKLFSPLTNPTAISGFRFPDKGCDLRIMWELPHHHALKNTVVVTSPGKLYYIDEDGIGKIISEDQKEIKAFGLDQYVQEVNAENISIKNRLSLTKLKEIDEKIRSQSGHTHVLVPLPNTGTLGLVRKIQKECINKLNIIERRKNEFKNYMETSTFDLENFKFRSTMRLLESRDLLRMINAVRDTKDYPDLNLDIKSRLAALVADMDEKQENREAYLKDAHNIAVNLVNAKNFDHLLSIINTLSKHAKSTQKDKLLCRELITQLALTDFIPFMLNKKNELNYGPSFYIRTLMNELPDDPETFKNRIANTLEMLDPKDLLTILDKAENDLQAKINLAVFEIILKKGYINKATLQEKLIDKKEHKEEKITDKDKTQIILKSLYDLYNEEKSDIQLQNKIGIFMAGLALHNTYCAQLIFDPMLEESQRYQEIVRKECLANSSKHKILLYEAMINSFDFNYSADHYDTLVDNNRDIIIGMHKTLSSLEQYDNEEEKIIAEYKENPWKLCEMQVHFIKTCLSKNSIAQENIERFFAATVMAANSDPNKLIQQKLIDQYYANWANIENTYMAFLPIKTMNTLWEQEKQNLVAQLDKHIAQIQTMQKSLLDKAKEKNMRDKIQKDSNKFIEKIKLFRKEFGGKIFLEIPFLNIHLGTQGKKNKLPTYCYEARNRIKTLLDDWTEKREDWIGSLSHIEQKFVAPEQEQTSKILIRRPSSLSSVSSSPPSSPSQSGLFGRGESKTSNSTSTPPSTPSQNKQGSKLFPWNWGRK